jgi:hypothetical protein
MFDQDRVQPAKRVKIERNGRCVAVFFLEKDEYEAMLLYDAITVHLREGKLRIDIETLDRVNEVDR